jgi:phosphatidylglycerophosphate synthase
MQERSDRSGSWMTKPTDRFVLKWIKCNLSARISPRLTGINWMRPWMITVASLAVSVLAGLLFALGHGGLAGLLAAASQVLDGVDGQFARLTGRQSPTGALLDSVLDRYSDGSLMIGMVLYLIRLPSSGPLWPVLVLASLAFMGSNLVSYSSARAEGLGLPLPPKHTLCTKGTRTSVMAVSGLLTLFWPWAPALALGYLAVHSNLAVIHRLRYAGRA